MGNGACPICLKPSAFGYNMCPRHLADVITVLVDLADGSLDIERCEEQNGSSGNIVVIHESDTFDEQTGGPPFSVIVGLSEDQLCTHIRVYNDGDKVVLLHGRYLGERSHHTIPAAIADYDERVMENFRYAGGRIIPRGSFVGKNMMEAAP